MFGGKIPHCTHFDFHLHPPMLRYDRSAWSLSNHFVVSHSNKPATVN